VYFLSRLPRSRACQAPCVSFPCSFFFGLPHPELASSRHFANVFANAFSTLFHHASCLPHVPSRRHVVIRNYPVLECLISIAFLDLVVAPRLSSLCKIRTQDSSGLPPNGTKPDHSRQGGLNSSLMKGLTAQVACYHQMGPSLTAKVLLSQRMHGDHCYLLLCQSILPVPEIKDLRQVPVQLVPIYKAIRVAHPGGANCVNRLEQCF
jgi:hypothetical protein